MIDVKLKGKQAEDETGYPCLKISKRTGRVILFLGPKRGLQIKSNMGKSNLCFDSNWVESEFQPYPGIIELQNRTKKS